MPIWKDKKGRWRYQFQFKGKRYSKVGFSSREEAAKAMEIYRCHLGLLVRREDLQSLMTWAEEIAADKGVSLPGGYFRIKADLEQ